MSRKKSTTSSTPTHDAEGRKAGGYFILRGGYGILRSASGRWWTGSEWSDDPVEAQRFGDGPDPWADARAAADVLVEQFGEPCAVAYVLLGSRMAAKAGGYYGPARLPASVEVPPPPPVEASPPKKRRRAAAKRALGKSGALPPEDVSR